MAVVAGTLLLPGSAFAAKFTSGVTAGEITDQSAIIWGRAAESGPVRAQVATDDAFQNVVAQRSLQAVVGNNNTIQVRIGRLKPNRTHYYRFCIQGGSGCSSVGKFLTAPSATVTTPIKFAFSGDETGYRQPGDNEPFWGTYTAFRTMAAANNDFNIDFGDTIYSDPEVPGAPTALGVGEKWGITGTSLRSRTCRGSAP